MGILICPIILKNLIDFILSRKGDFSLAVVSVFENFTAKLRVKTQGDEEKSGVNGRLRKLVQTLIQASLQDALLNMYKG